MRRQLVELRASRRRLLRAGDEERRRLERRLRETVERRLIALARTLAGAHATAGAARLRGAEEQLAHTLEELGELAAGLHPGGMDEGRLADALASLVARGPVPVELSVPDTRLPEEVATAAYFVCSEALANVGKYAGASRVTISMRAGDGRVQVEVRDDGVGGANPANGSGLRGLADRVEALGGTLAGGEPAGPRHAGDRRAAARPAARADVASGDVAHRRADAPPWPAGPDHGVAEVHRRDRLEIQPPSAWRSNVNVSVVPAQSKTSRLPMISYVPE